MLLRLLPLLVLAACATQETILQNEKTGEIVTCGGSSVGSVAGGMIGYNIQKSNDQTCVESHLSTGFKVIKVNPAK